MQRFTALLAVSTALALAAPPAENRVVLDAMNEELQRNLQALKQKADPPPYYLAYEITEQESWATSATFGALNSSGHSKNRFLDTTLRVGSPKLDNFRRVRGERIQFTSGVQVAVDDSPAAIKERLWLETDRVYRAAAERLIKITTNQQVKSADRDPSDDFSKEEAYSHFQPTATMKIVQATWEGRVRELSKEFAKTPEILTSNVQFIATADNRYFVSSEGSKIQHGRGFARIIISASAKTKEGADVSDFESVDAMDPKDLPTDDQIRASIGRISQHVKDLLQAPTTDPFVGPAIFSGRASGVFFHEIFGHRIEGHRQKDEAEGQTFTKSVGQKILPDFLSVTFDPTLKRAANEDLNGWYEYDDEGVAAKPVKAVENGILKTFLMSRSPIEGFDHSNGHGRRQPGLEVVSRQSNLVVTSTKSYTDAQLREMLIAEIKKQNKPYGLYFADITGGYTTTGRAGLQAFKVMPVIVYRVFADGRPDQLIRGADIVGTPLASFNKILATSDKTEVFNGYCGAESGSVPVSALSPAILISEIEIEKKDQSQDLPPLLPPPPVMPTPGAGGGY